jgi:assimilatory nitrate reductase catalytic subunit
MTRTGISGKLLSHIESPYIEMHPKDIEQYELKKDGFACLSNQFGKFIGKVVENSDIRVGDVFAPIHWTDQFAKNGVISAVVSPEVDSYSGQPESKATPVSIAALDFDAMGVVSIDSSLHDSFDVSVFDYWYKAPCEDGYRYFVGISGEFDWPSLIAGLRSDGDKMLSYKNPFQQDERYAVVDQSNVKFMAFMRSEIAELPSFSWLESVMQQQVSEQANELLVVEYASQGKTICSCFQVFESSIVEEIENGCVSAEQLGEVLKCGTNCGSCIPELNALIAKNTKLAS